MVISRDRKLLDHVIDQLTEILTQARMKHAQLSEQKRVIVMRQLPPEIETVDQSGIGKETPVVLAGEGGEHCQSDSCYAGADSHANFLKPLVLSFSASRYGEPATFGDFVKKARLEKGLKQAEVARVVEVDEMTIVNWERCTTVPLRANSQAEALCKVLGMNWVDVKQLEPRRDANLQKTGSPA